MPTESSNPAEPNPAATCLPIAAVERDTGIGKDTLRVWERRYGYPAPLRDGFGERVYPLEQVHTLRVVKRLLDAGHRPGRVLRLSPQQIRALADSAPATPLARGRLARHDLDQLLAMIAHHDSAALQAELQALLQRLGARRFVLEVAAPMNLAVGEAWLRGQLEVFEEHAYTEQVQTLLRQILAEMPAAAQPLQPRVLLSTLPGEPHALGILMAQAILSLEGCHCVSLGAQTPVVDLARAAQAHDTQIVALSATGIQGSRPLWSGLTELRALLPSHVELWVGGSASVLRRRRLDGLTNFATLEAIPAAVKRWRQANPGAKHGPQDHTAAGPPSTPKSAQQPRPA